MRGAGCLPILCACFLWTDEVRLEVRESLQDVRITLIWPDGIYFCNTDWTFEAEWCLHFCNFGSLPVRNSPAAELLLHSSVLLPALLVVTYSSILIVCWHVNCAPKQLWQHFSTKQRWHSPLSRWYKGLRPPVATISTPLSTLMVLYITIKIEEYTYYYET